MTRYVDVLIQMLTLGKESGQAFLGARSIERLLRIAPHRYRRRLALTVLSWSPHYFFRKSHPDYAALSHAEFVEREFERNRVTREKLCDQVLLAHLDGVHVVLDYGCGPGFLANSVSRHVDHVYGIDLSKGVLECARILHGSPRVTFLHTERLGDVADESVDLVYCFAVVQHVTDSVFADILDVMRRKLKPEGKLLLHVALEESAWRKEEEWKADTSTKGRLKMKYALNCFDRTEQRVRSILVASGFRSVSIQPMTDVCTERFDDVCDQHLVLALK